MKSFAIFAKMGYLSPKRLLSPLPSNLSLLPCSDPQTLGQFSSLKTMAISLWYSPGRMRSEPTLDASSVLFSVLEAAFAAASVAIAAFDIFLTGVFIVVDSHSGACPSDSIQASHVRRIC